jgi:toxin ParE1/3/4
MPRIIRRERALTDILEHWSYLAVQSGEDQADAFVLRLEEQLQMLARYPYSGRSREELRPGLRSMPLPPYRYVIFYYPLDDGMIVSRILYGGRDIEHKYDDEGSAAAE